MLKMDVIIVNVTTKTMFMQRGNSWGEVIKVPLGTEIPKGWGDANQKPSVVGVSRKH